MVMLACTHMWTPGQKGVLHAQVFHAKPRCGGHKYFRHKRNYCLLPVYLTLTSANPDAFNLTRSLQPAELRCRGLGAHTLVTSAKCQCQFQVYLFSD